MSWLRQVSKHGNSTQMQDMLQQEELTGKRVCPDRQPAVNVLSV